MRLKNQKEERQNTCFQTHTTQRGAQYLSSPSTHKSRSDLTSQIRLRKYVRTTNMLPLILTTHHRSSVQARTHVGSSAVQPEAHCAAATGSAPSYSLTELGPVARWQNSLIFEHASWNARRKSGEMSNVGVMFCLELEFDVQNSQNCI